MKLDPGEFRGRSDPLRNQSVYRPFIVGEASCEPAAALPAAERSSGHEGAAPVFPSFKPRLVEPSCGHIRPQIGPQTRVLSFSPRLNQLTSMRILSPVRARIVSGRREYDY